MFTCMMECEDETMDISIVIPVYGCKKAVSELYRRIVVTLEKMGRSFEIIMVEDSCPQKSWEEIKKLCQDDKRVVGIKLSRNFGQMKAITAGLKASCGDRIIVMDCDLQDRPEYIENLWNKAEEGFDIVYSKRKNRKDNFLVRLLSKMFYIIYNHFSDMKYDFEVGNFSIANRKVIDAFLEMGENSRDYIMFLMWLGFKDTTIEIEGDKRFSGASAYTFRKKVNLAISLITEQSNKPLIISVKFGLLISLASAIYIVYIILRSVLVGDLDMGWPTIVASIYLVGGLILGALGIAGIYIGNIFTETKNRPLYIVDESINGKEGEY